MSLPRKVTVNCSKCGKPLTATMFHSVNSEYAEDIASQIISGKLFDVECPHCKFVSHLEYDMLYHDMLHEAMIWVLHENSENYASTIAELRSSQIFQYKTLRVVADMNALKEKVFCLEHGRDDRVIELCKVFAVHNWLYQHPDFAFRNAFYTVSSDEELILIYDNNDNYLCYKLPDNAYNHLKTLYYNSPYSTQFDGNYAIVDYAWAEQILHSLIDAEVKEPNSIATEHQENMDNYVVDKAILTCPECKREIPSDSEFCPKCGTKIAVQKRLFIAETEHKKKKTVKIIAILIAVVLAALLIINAARNEIHRSQLRNMATEQMDDSFINVYADVVSIEPVFFVYEYQTTSSGAPIGSGTLCEVVCRCETVEGKTIWATIFYHRYPNGNYSLRESDYKPLSYSSDNPIRLTGSIVTSRHVAEDMEYEIGDVFVLSVRELSN